MNDELKIQEEYWDETVREFDSIYSKKKSGFSVMMDKVFRWDMYERFRFTIDECSPAKDKTVLDVGCGSGRYMETFAKKGAVVTGIDIAANMIETAKKICSQAGVMDNCKFFQTDLLEFNTEEKYNYTIGIGLFDYIKDPLPVLIKMHKLTSDKSVMSFPRTNTWRAPVRKVRLSLKGCPVYFFSKKTS